VICALARYKYTTVHDRYPLIFTKIENLVQAFHTTMQLILSNDSPLSTTITDSLGQTFYHVSTVHKCGPQKTTIHRLHAAPPSYYTSMKDSQSVQSDDKTLIDNQDNESAELASIEWHTFASSKLTYEGKEVDLKEFMPNEKSFCRG